MAVRARMEDVDVPEVSCRLYVRAGGGKVLYKLYCIPLYCIPQSPPRAKSLPVSGFPQCLPQHAQRSATPSPTLPHDAGSVQPRWPLLLARTFTMSSSACSAPSSGFPPTLPYSGAAAWCTRCCHTYFLLFGGFENAAAFALNKSDPQTPRARFFAAPAPQISGVYMTAGIPLPPPSRRNSGSSTRSDRRCQQHFCAPADAVSADDVGTGSGDGSGDRFASGGGEGAAASPGFP